MFRTALAFAWPSCVRPCTSGTALELMTEARPRRLACHGAARGQAAAQSLPPRRGGLRTLGSQRGESVLKSHAVSPARSIQNPAHLHSSTFALKLMSVGRKVADAIVITRQRRHRRRGLTVDLASSEGEWEDLRNRPPSVTSIS